MGELWAGEATTNLGIRIGSTVLTGVHNAEKCAGRPCVLHNPTEHHMRSWRTIWRADKGIMERECPHQVGHPDPDDLAYARSLGDDYKTVHGCDGCCNSAIATLPEPICRLGYPVEQACDMLAADQTDAFLQLRPAWHMCQGRDRDGKATTCYPSTHGLVFSTTDIRAFIMSYKP